MKLEKLLSWRRAHAWPLLAIALSAASVVSGYAAPIPVTNHSFESATYTGTNSWTNDLFDTDPATDNEWIGRDGNASGQAFIERIGGFVSEGQAHIGMESGYFIFQDTQVPWEANTRYTLTVGVGNRNAGFTPDGVISVIGLTIDEDSDEFLEGIDTFDQLDIDPLLAEANTDFAPATLDRSTFQDVVLVYDTDDTPPDGTVVIFLGDDSTAGRSHFDNVRLDATGLADSDGDTLPDDWEQLNFSDLDEVATGDPDSDGSTNLDEFTRGTDPNDDDSDDDGAKDGVETKTGVFVSVDDTGTDPLNPDTDNDTLLDGDEIVATPATDPNDADSDDDGFEDQAEIASSTDPTVADSFPSIEGDVVFSINFIGGRVDGTPGAMVTGEAGVVARSNWNNVASLGGQGVPLVDSSGGEIIPRISWSVDDTFTTEFDVPASQNGALMHGYLKTRNDVATTITIRNIAYPSYDVYIYTDSTAIDGATSDFAVNGQVVLGVQDFDNFAFNETFTEASEESPEGNYVVFRGVTGNTISITPTISDAGQFGAAVNGIQIVRATTDTDGDGMPDVYEDSNGLDKSINDAGGDLDGDSLTNFMEFENGTDPQARDTDGDGYDDNVETGTGVFVDAGNTGSNPLVRDTDKDGLNDGVETGSGTFANAMNTGTDPNVGDSDGDGFGDGEEVSASTNPTDAASRPPFPTVIGYWSFDDQGQTETADLSVNGFAGEVFGDDIVYVAGHSGAPGDFALQFDGVSTSVETGQPLLDDLEEFSMSGWVNFDVEQLARTGFFGQNDVIEFGMSAPTIIDYWRPTDNAISAPFGPTDGWVHVAVVSRFDSRSIYIDGVEVAEGAVTTVNAFTEGSFNIGGGGILDAAGNNFLGLIDDVAVWDEALSPSVVKGLASGFFNPLGPVDGPDPVERLPILDVTYDEGTATVTVTFAAVAGETYDLEASPDLSTWTKVAETTTGVVSESGIPAGTGMRFYRVRRQ